MFAMANRTGLQDMMRGRAEVVAGTAELDKRDRYIARMRPHHRVSWCEFYDQASGCSVLCIGGHCLLGSGLAGGAQGAGSPRCASATTASTAAAVTGGHGAGGAFLPAFHQLSCTLRRACCCLSGR